MWAENTEGARKARTLTGPKETRTPDLLDAIQALSQLSYGPPLIALDSRGHGAAVKFAVKFEGESLAPSLAGSAVARDDSLLAAADRTESPGRG